MKKENSSQLCDDFAEGLDVLEEHKRPFLTTSESCAFNQKSFNALQEVLLIFFKD